MHLSLPFKIPYTSTYPCRSRFQARLVRPESYFSHLLPPNASASLEHVLSHAAAMRVLDGDPQYAGIVPPVLGEEQLERVFALLQRAPDLSPARALHAVNPHSFSPERQAALVAKSLAKFQLGSGPGPMLVSAGPAGKTTSTLSSPPLSIAASAGQPYVLNATQADTRPNTVKVELRNTVSGAKAVFPLPGHPENLQAQRGLVQVEAQDRLLAEMLLAFSSGDVCLVGARGAGKSALVDAAAGHIGAPCVHVMVHKDMTARDLLQQRTTEANGDTAWKPAPLVAAAINGRCGCGHVLCFYSNLQENIVSWYLICQHRCSRRCSSSGSRSA